MKKLLVLFVLLFVLLSMMGCKPTGKNEDGITSDLAGEGDTSDPSGTTEEAVPHEVGFDDRSRLHFEIDGAHVVYEILARGIGSLTPKELLGTFRTETEVEGIIWEIYSVEEFSDLEYVVVISGTNSAWICRAVEDTLSAPENPRKSERIWDIYHSGDWRIGMDLYVTIPSLDYATVWFGDDAVYVNDDPIPGLSKPWITGFYLSDLTGDGRPELCFASAVGSGVVSFHIQVFDAVTREELFGYSSIDLLMFSETLCLENGTLCVKKIPYGSNTAIRIGEFKYDGSEINIEWKESEIEGARIELSYMGDKQRVIPFYEGERYEFLLNAISAAGGTKGESTKGYYGIPYTLTVYTAEGESYVFHLWSETQYSTSRHTDSEGYPYFFYDDLSKLYKYLDGNFSEDYWPSWIQ